MFKRIVINYKNINPIQQGLFCAFLVTIIALCCSIFQVKSMQAWDMILSPIFIFCCYNSIIGAFVQKPIQYTIISIFVLFILSFYIYILGNFVSNFSYQESQELHLIVALVFVFYVLLYLLCIVFRIILYLLHEADK